MSLTNGLLEQIRGPSVEDFPLGLVSFSRIFKLKPGSIKLVNDSEGIEKMVFDPIGIADGEPDTSYTPKLKYNHPPQSGWAFEDCVLVRQRTLQLGGSDRNLYVVKYYQRAFETARLADVPVHDRDQNDRRTIQATYVILHSAPTANKEGDIGVDTFVDANGDNLPEMVLAAERRVEGEAIDRITRTFVEATENLEQIGEPYVVVEAEGLAYRVTYIQLASATYVPGVVGTTEFQGFKMDRETSQGNASIRTVTRWFTNNRIKVSRSPSKVGRSCSQFDIISVSIPTGETFTPDPSWMLVEQRRHENAAGDLLALTRTYITTPTNTTYPESTIYSFPSYRQILAAGSVLISDIFTGRRREVTSLVQLQFIRQDVGDPIPTANAIEFELIEDLTTEVIPSITGFGTIRTYPNTIGDITINDSFGLGYSESGQSDPVVYPSGYKRVSSTVDVWRCGLDGQIIYIRRSVSIPF